MHNSRLRRDVSIYLDSLAFTSPKFLQLAAL